MDCVDVLSERVKSNNKLLLKSELLSDCDIYLKKYNVIRSHTCRALLTVQSFLEDLTRYQPLLPSGAQRSCALIRALTLGGGERLR